VLHVERSFIFVRVINCFNFSQLSAGVFQFEISSETPSASDVLLTIISVCVSFLISL
jgi:hypothetical protein